jgi:hypothetical protein
MSSIRKGVSIFSNWDSPKRNNNIKASTIPICFFEKNWQKLKTYFGPTISLPSLASSVLGVEK